MDNGTKVLLVLHIAAAALWVGGGVTTHLFGRLALASGDRQRMLQFSKDANKIGPRFYAPLSVVLLVAGILLVDEAGYEMSDTFVTMGFAGWVVSFVVGVGYYSRADKKQDAIVASDGLESEAFLAAYRQVMYVNLVELAILLFVVFAMVWKPGL